MDHHGPSWHLQPGLAAGAIRLRERCRGVLFISNLGFFLSLPPLLPSYYPFLFTKTIFRNFVSCGKRRFAGREDDQKKTRRAGTSTYDRDVITRQRPQPRSGSAGLRTGVWSGQRESGPPSPGLHWQILNWQSQVCHSIDSCQPSPGREFIQFGSGCKLNLERFGVFSGQLHPRFQADTFGTNAPPFNHPLVLAGSPFPHTVNAVQIAKECTGQICVSEPQKKHRRQPATFPFNPLSANPTLFDSIPLPRNQ